jgi:hypothetical protein
MNDQAIVTLETSRRASSRSPRLRFVAHFVEMLVAMFVGMAAFGLALGAGLGALGLDYSSAEHPSVGSVEMAFTMSAGMALWMRIRRHAWRGILEMSAAMFAPLAFVLPLLSFDAIGPDAAMMIMHVAMLPLMLVVMLLRRDHYGYHVARQPGTA